MSGGGSARKEINMDNKAYQKMDYALCLLSAAADGKRHGCIVNSFHQVTSSFPPKFTVAVNKDHETCKAIQAAGSFSVTLLGADAPGEIIDLFGYKSGRVTDKFAGRAAETDSNGNPYLKEHMVSRIACKVVDQMEIGSFLLFVGQATEAEVLGDGRVLTLQAYTDRGKATPPTATVYRTVEINGYRCTVCGYVYEGDPAAVKGAGEGVAAKLIGAKPVLGARRRHFVHDVHVIRIVRREERKHGREDDDD